MLLKAAILHQGHGNRRQNTDFSSNITRKVKRYSLPWNIAHKHPVTILVLIRRHILRPIHRIHKLTLSVILACKYNHVQNHHHQQANTLESNQQEIRLNWHTNGETGEHILEGSQQLLIPSIRLKINLPEIRRAINSDLDIGAGLQRVPPEIPHRRPPNHLRPKPQVYQ